MQFVIWGAGERGNRVFYHVKDYVKAFIDQDEGRWGTEYCNRPVISLEKYAESYSDCYIIISYSHEDEVIQKLLKYGIHTYFLLSDCPGEFQESHPRDLLKEHIKHIIRKNQTYVIYGCTLYAMILNQWIYDVTGAYVPIICPDEISQKKKEELETYFSEYTFVLIDKINKSDQPWLHEVLVSVDQDKRILDRLRSRMKVTDVYDCSDQIEAYHNKELEKFRGIHRGKRCFIVATGPSLRMEDLEKLLEHGEICFSMNAIWREYQDIKWRPDYYVVGDYRAVNEILQNGVQFTKELLFIADTSKEFWDTEHGKNVYKFHYQYEYSEKRQPKFSEDFSQKCYHGSTVTYCCIQMAAYMGFEEIYLLGVDFTYAKNRDQKYGHFYKEEKLVALGYSEHVGLAYLSAYEYARSHGIRIYNATRGGSLEIFDRVDFDSLFEGKLYSMEKEKDYI